MPKIVIVYDSKTGNTEAMARSIAEGARSISNTEVVFEKLGKSFSFSIFGDADAVMFGSPSHHGHVTPEMLVFLAELSDAIDSGVVNVEDKIGLAFGSYGWDSGVCIEKLSDEMLKLGFKMDQGVLAKPEPNADPSANPDIFRDCREAGKNLAKKIQTL